MRCPCGSGLSVGNCQHYKEGDRVEAIKPPTGVEDSQADQIGLGEITAINLGEQNGETHKVMLDSGEEWWYSEDRLRLVTAAKPPPTPSITVGTQVRLTGVVARNSQDVDEAHWVKVIIDGTRSYGLSLYINKEALEVIRQPFKRGEVVHLRGSTVLEPAMVLEDESDGRIIYISLLNVEGQYPHKALASDFERRPSRPKEER